MSHSRTTQLEQINHENQILIHTLMTSEASLTKRVKLLESQCTKLRDALGTAIDAVDEYWMDENFESYISILEVFRSTTPPNACNIIENTKENEK